HLFNLQNPALYGLIIVALILIFLIFIRKEISRPPIYSENEAENENLKLMALFAEIDPDPILRVNDQGEISGANNTAIKNFKDHNLIGSKFSEIVPNIGLDNINFLNDEVINISDRFFSMSIRKISSLNFHQIYLHDITDRVEYENQIKDYQLSLQKLRTRLENFNESEKQRIGKELHDSIGQNVSLLKIKIQNFLEKNSNSQISNEIESLLNDIDTLSSDIKDISYELRPRILNEFGIVAALSSVIDSINNSSNMRGSISMNKSELRINKDFELNLFRICQEGIANIVRHSNCKNFFIQFIVSENELRLIISDDGVGFKLDKPTIKDNPSLGLLNMKERASNYKGELNIESSPNEGTTLFIVFKNLKEYENGDKSITSR
ncbi:MAG: sensor histidine kinase, partial [Melioribacteraceae bacterium]|nr:sensor histidine kinase [Melioribacteraceae bacterium]